MPKWMRLKTTRDAPLLDRMGSALENGYSDEGPLARILGVGGCFGLVFLAFIFTIGIAVTPFVVIAWLMGWIG